MLIKLQEVLLWASDPSNTTTKQGHNQMLKWTGKTKSKAVDPGMDDCRNESIFCINSPRTESTRSKPWLAHAANDGSKFGKHSSPI